MIRSMMLRWGPTPWGPTSTSLILLRSNLHIPPKPLHHLLPICQVLTWLTCPTMRRGRGTHKLHRHLPHHLQSHVELLRLLDGTAQVILRMQEKRGCRHTASMSKRRTFTIVLSTLLVPWIAF